MISILFFLLFPFAQEEVPFKAAEEFEISLEYEFKQHPSPNANEIMLNEANGVQTKRASASPLPYIVLNLKVLKASNQEVRLKVYQHKKQFLSKKGIQNGSEVKIELGFTDDVKDRVSPHEYTFFFLDGKKSETSKIEIFVGEDGTFLVNGEKRGKF